MKLLPADATDAEIVAACQEWIERMVAGDVAGGIDMLHVPGRYDDSQRWTPASLLAYIGNYGSWDPPHQSGTWTITSPAM
ncbi:hypothetical protein, partial [Salmonella sp. SKLX083065]|uniref:hypothetical protein n=1 Tax=Salmonella sp. SKLX083065 TaxID=3159982 RepID=UPI0037550DE1